MTTCFLCNNEAGWVGWDRDPQDERARRIPVCGLHMITGDERMGD